MASTAALQLGTKGQTVIELQAALQNTGTYTGDIDGSFGPATAAAVSAFQQGRGIAPTGTVDASTAQALQLSPPTPLNSALPQLTAALVGTFLPETPIQNIEANLPCIVNALADVHLADRQMICMALATIRTEASCFLPVSECMSAFNTSSGGHPFDLYDGRSDLGNAGAPDGANYRGRGFVQLTGRANFKAYGQAVGCGDQLVLTPTLAHRSEIAAKLLAGFLKAHEKSIRSALGNNNLLGARQLVNGGSHGLAEFSTTYQKAMLGLQQVFGGG